MKKKFLIACVFFSLNLVQIILCNPRVSIITSVYDGDEFIEGFLENMVKQTIFDQCELIMVNAYSPGYEEPVIRKYMQICPNIRYIKLDSDPGIYGVWNLCIQIARAPYIVNCNLDDRFAFDALEAHAKALDNDERVDLVYSDHYVTFQSNRTFKKRGPHKFVITPECTKKNMLSCPPRNAPMWRKTLHEQHGFFDVRYKVKGDWEMWLRAVKGGAIFKKITGVYGLYYENPHSLSVRSKNLGVKEFRAIYKKYNEHFQWNLKVPNF